MKKMLIRVLTLITVLQLILVACSSQKEYAATVDGYKVSVQEFNMYLYEVQKSFETLGGTDIWETDFEGKTAEEVAKEAALNSIAYIKITAKQAKGMNVFLTKEEKVQAKTDALTTIGDLDQETVEKMDIDEDTLTKIMEEKSLQNKVYAEVTKNFELNEKDFELYYLDFLEEQRELLISLDIQYIFLAKSTDNAENIPEKANQVLDLAKSGKDFDELVKTYSEDKGENNGKEIISKNMYTAEFEDAAFALDIGKISDLVATDLGYYIIKLNNIIEPDLEDTKKKSKEDYIATRKQEIFEQEYEKWKYDKKIEKNSEVWDKIKIEL